MVHAFTLLMETPTAAVDNFNIGQPSEISIMDLAKRVVELAESDSEIRLVPYDDQDAYGERAAGFEDMRRRVPNAAKLHQFTGFAPKIGLEQTLREVIHYELANTEPAYARGRIADDGEDRSRVCARADRRRAGE